MLVDVNTPPLERINDVNRILNHRIGNDLFNEFINAYATGILQALRISDQKKELIRSKMQHFFHPILKKKLIETVSQAYADKFKEITDSELKNIANSLDEGLSGRSLVQMRPNARFPVVPEGVIVYSSDLFKRFYSLLEAGEKEIDLAQFGPLLAKEITAIKLDDLFDLLKLHEILKTVRFNQTT